MPPTFRLPLAAVLAAALFGLAACGGDDSSSSSSSSSGAATQAQAPSSSCQKDQLALTKAGQLTIATDKPAYPPYCADDDPTNGKGFESAVAYAVARQLGFTKDEVKWKVVPFNSSYAPGPKK